MTTYCLGNSHVEAAYSHVTITSLDHPTTFYVDKTLNIQCVQHCASQIDDPAPTKCHEQCCITVPCANVGNHKFQIVLLPVSTFCS